MVIRVEKVVAVVDINRKLVGLGSYLFLTCALAFVFCGHLATSDGYGYVLVVETGPHALDERTVVVFVKAVVLVKVVVLFFLLRKLEAILATQRRLDLSKLGYLLRLDFIVVVANFVE